MLRVLTEWTRKPCKCKRDMFFGTVEHAGKITEILACCECGEQTFSEKPIKDGCGLTTFTERNVSQPTESKPRNRMNQNTIDFMYELRDLLRKRKAGISAYDNGKLFMFCGIDQIDFNNIISDGVVQKWLDTPEGSE